MASPNTQVSVSIIPVRGLELRGAYGRETNMEDWRQGKDFQIWFAGRRGPYCSVRDLQDIKDANFDILEFRSLTGQLVERIVLKEELDRLLEGTNNEFVRITDLVQGC